MSIVDYNKLFINIFNYFPDNYREGKRRRKRSRRREILAHLIPQMTVKKGNGLRKKVIMEVICSGT
jgi:hypothetical protein